MAPTLSDATATRYPFFIGVADIKDKIEAKKEEIEEEEEKKEEPKKEE